MKYTVKSAFTLAEVLITLVIIGVIATLTVPTLIKNTQKQEYVSALKKAYSALSQATQMIIAEEGSPKGEEGGWANTAENVYLMYKKYLSNVKDCSTDSGCFNQLSGNVRYKYLKGGTHGDSFNTAGRYKLILADGTQVLFIGPYPKCNYYYTPSGTKDSCECKITLGLIICNTTNDNFCNVKLGFCLKCLHYVFDIIAKIMSIVFEFWGF